MVSFTSNNGMYHEMVLSGFPSHSGLGFGFCPIHFCVPILATEKGQRKENTKVKQKKRNKLLSFSRFDRIKINFHPKIKIL